MTEPKGNKYLKLTRPIEFVKRDASCQQGTMAANIAIFTLFVLSGILNYESCRPELILLVFTCVMFGLTALFYGLTVKLDPGYVKKQPNFLRLLKQLIAENYHLDYVCVPCETLMPENAQHCNYCNRCVQKFDHHCVFINNCLGYKNHRYFLLFLLSYAFYLLGVLAHSIIIIYLACSDKDTQIGYVTLNVAAQSVLVVIVFIHSPVLLL